MTDTCASGPVWVVEEFCKGTLTRWCIVGEIENDGPLYPSQREAQEALELYQESWGARRKGRGWQYRLRRYVPEMPR